MRAPPRKPKPDFIVRLVAPRLRPWTVPMRTVTRVMDAIQRLVDQRDEGEADGAGEIAERTEEQAGESGRILHLLNIKSSSAAYEVAAHERASAALRVIRETGEAIRAPEGAEWSSASLSAIKALSEIGKSFECEIELRRPPTRGSRFGNILAKITPATYDEISSFAFIYGTTSLFARIERVGGATEMHCGIRLPESPRKMVICHVQSEDTVRELGRYIYQYVTLTGVATWYRHNWQVKHLEIHTIEPPKTGSILEALKRIHEAGGDAWDDIEDPNALIAEIRGT